MARFYFLITFLSTFLVTTVSAQVFVDQNFEAGTLPGGWLRQQSTPSKGWEFGNNSTKGSDNVAIPSHTSFAISNDDAYDNNAATANIANRDMLITPSFSLAGINTALLKFDAFYTGQYGSLASVEISTNGGSSWTLLQTLATSPGWQSITVDLAAYTGQANVKLAFVHNDSGQWAHAFGVDDVLVLQPFANDVQLVSVSLPSATQLASLPVSITVRNFGTSVLNSFQFTWTKDNGTLSFTDEVNGLGLAPGGVATLLHNSSVVLATEGLDTVVVTLSLPNGQVDNTVNNRISSVIATSLGTVDHNVVFEQHTGTWCGWCPDGMLVLESIVNSDSTLIPVTLHDDDGMDFADGNTVNGALVAGFPSGSIDRFKFDGQAKVGVSRNLWEDLVAERSTFKSFASVSASNNYNATTRELTVDVEAQFLKSLTGDYRVNVYIVEDSVTGTGSGFSQRNFFRNNPDYVGHPFYSLPDPMVGFVHRHVSRYFMGGAWGQAAVIPTSIVPLTPYDHTFTYTLPAGWNEDRIRLIAVIQKYGTTANDRQIINAISMPLNSSNANDLEVAPAPADVAINYLINSACGGGMEGEASVTPIGCSDCTFQWSNGQTGLNLFDVIPGTYTVTMSNTTGINVVKSINIYGPILLNPNIVYSGGIGNVTLNIQGGKAPYTINWSNGGTTATQSALAYGDYQVTVTDGNGCSTVQTLKISLATGVIDVASTINFNVYPNPTAGNVTVEADLANADQVTIQVFNTMGALVSERTLSGQAQVREVLDLTAQANGVYIVKVTADGSTGVKRLVLNR